jgi:hypothetical protein
VINLSHEEHEKFLKGLQVIHQSNLDNNGYRRKLDVEDEGTIQQCIVCKLDPPKYQFAMLTSGVLVRRSRENPRVYKPVGDPAVLTQEEFNAVMLLAKAARIKTGEEFEHTPDPNH